MKKHTHTRTNQVAVIVLVAVLPFAVSSCTDDFVSINTPPHQISEGNIDVSLLGQSFAHAQFNGMFGSAGAFQLGQSLFGDLYSQYFATTAENFDSDQFVEVGRWIDGAWRNFYGNAARSLSFIEQYSTENEGLELQNAIAEIWKVQVYHRMTDYWGPILYSQVGNGETSVPYDSQQDVYMDFFRTLDEAVALLSQNRGSKVFAGHDQVFDGNVDQWITFANSLRLRLAMRIRYADPGKAQSEAEKAVSAGVMMSNSDNAMLLTTNNSRNPYNVITNWGEFRMSSAMESILEGYNDPRIGIYFSPSADGDSDEDGSPYEGMRNGLPRVQKGSVLNSQFSDMGSDWLPPNRGGTNPAIRIMAASEVYLLRAEGAILGWNMGGSAKSLYDEGIRMSLTESRVGANMEDVDAYIAGTTPPAAPEDDWSSPPLSDIPVALDTGGSTERQLEQIITQKWLAIYPDGWEAYAEYRRTGYPKLYPIIESQNSRVATDQVMRRMTFVSSEYDDNGEATQAAVALLGGPDENDTRVWWDKK